LRGRGDLFIVIQNVIQNFAWVGNSFLALAVLKRDDGKILNAMLSWKIDGKN